MKESKQIKIHQACPCGESSDGFAIYDDGHGYCFGSCGGKYYKKVEGEYMVDKKKTEESVKSSKLKTKGKPGAIGERKIAAKTVQKYGVELIVNTKKETVKHVYPYFNKACSERIGSKIRRVINKEFHTEGSMKDLALFGQQLFTPGGKYLTIVEGELDALAAWQMLGSDDRSVVVSVFNSSMAKRNIVDNWEWVDSFDNIVLALDNDEAGNKAASDITELFAPSKCRKVTLSIYKDPCQYLNNNKTTAFVDQWWKAQPVMPDNIILGSDLFERLKNKKEIECIDLPWGSLNDLTYGIRLTEMLTLTAGSGMGKTQVLRELAYHFLKTTDYNIGGLFLEESVEESAEGLMSIQANKPLHLPIAEYTDKEYKDAFNETLGTKRVYYYDSFGESNINTIVNKIRYLGRVANCKIIFLDHISIIVSDQSQGDERKALDEVATKLKKLCMELGILLIMVSHSKRPSGKPHEEGGQTSLSELRGTAGIGQLSNMVLGLERDGQNEDEHIRNTTLIRVLKNRFSGLTGPACYLEYSKETGRLIEIDNPQLTQDDFEEEKDNESV